MHDKTVDRTTNGKGLVHQLTYRQLSGFNAAGKFSSSYSFVKVPLLKEVLEKIVSNRSILIIEIKDPGLYPGLVNGVASLVREARAEKNVMFFSFDLPVLQEVKKQLPGVKTGIFCLGYEDINRFPPSDYVCPYFLSVLYDPSIISRIHRKGRQVFVWNIDAVLMMKYLHGKKADGIITNRPDVFEEVFR
jgi:glycerophosphoryl diester phosphodiesterase